MNMAVLSPAECLNIIIYGSIGAVGHQWVSLLSHLTWQKAEIETTSYQCYIIAWDTVCLTVNCSRFYTVFVNGVQ